MSWILLYKNDSNGNSCGAELSALRKAVLEGRSLRVVTGSEATRDLCVWDLPLIVLVGEYVVGQTHPFQPLNSWTDLTLGSSGSPTTRTFSTNGQWREQTMAGRMPMAWYAES